MRFILVDTILELDPGKRIKASKALSEDEELFKDHFPGFPVVPGVLLTEMLAQAAGRCLDSEGTREGRAMLGKISSAKFHDWVRPGQEIILYATITQSRESFASAECYSEVSGKKVCSADLFFVFPSQLANGYRDEVLEKYWKAHPEAPPACGP